LEGRKKKGEKKGHRVFYLLSVAETWRRAEGERQHSQRKCSAWEKKSSRVTGGGGAHFGGGGGGGGGTGGAYLDLRGTISLMKGRRKMAFDAKIWMTIQGNE